jgi:2-oxoglutarate ferredoxin oxidoreductase subunit alpha
VVGWGSTYGAIRSAVSHIRDSGKKVSHLHLRHLNPFPKNTGEILYKFKHVLVPEMNLGQLSKVLRAKYLVPTISLNKIQGLPFKASEIESRIGEILKG